MNQEAIKELRELFRATASLNDFGSSQAREALAQAMREPILKTLDRAATVRNIYTKVDLEPGAESRFNLDLLFDEGSKTIRTWIMPKQGGMPHNFIEELEEVYVPTWEIASDVEWRLRFAREARIDIVSAAVRKMVQAIVRQEEDNGWNVLLSAAAANTGALGTGNVVNQDSAVTLSMQALNAAIVAFGRLNTSIDGGTPVGGAGRPTDIYMSIERMADVRGWTYQILNQYDGGTSNVVNTVLDDTTKREIFQSAGLASLWGMTFHPMNEFGKSKNFNNKFDTAFSSSSVILSTTYATGTRDFSTSADEVVMLLDQSEAGRAAFVMPVKMELQTWDDPIAIRENKQQVRGIEEIGFGVLDDRRLGALILNANGS